MPSDSKAIEGKMKKTVAALENEYGSIRAGRANPGILDRVTVDYYGSQTPVNQVAAVSVAEARTLVIQPWDISMLKAIEKSLNASDIGIHPQNDGKVIRMTFPPLTEERRKELVKTIHKYAEDAKVAVRAVRRDAIEEFKALKKKSEMTEDDLKDSEKEVQEFTDRFCKEVDSLSEKKEKEIMSF